MNILFPIITNLILVGIFATTFLLGKRLGWKATLFNAILLAGSTCGGYALAKIPFITAIHTNYFSTLSTLLFNCTVASIVGTTAFTISIIISLFASKSKRLVKVEKFNTAKIKRAKALDSKTEKLIRKQEKHAEKVSREYIKLTRKSRVFSFIAFLFIATAITCLSYVQIKSGLIILQEKTNIEWLDEGYEYTAIGQLDKII